MSAHRWCLLPAALLLAALGQLKAAPPAPEQLLPAGTAEFFAIPDVNRLADAWQQTLFARLIHDPAMKPFRDDLFAHTPEVNSLIHAIGSDFDKVKAAAGGEMSMSVVLVSPTEAASVLTVDYTGRRDQAQRLLNDLAQHMRKQGGDLKPRQLGDGMTAYVAEIPGKWQICLGMRDTLMIITDHLPTLIGMQQRWQGAANNALANVPAFQAVRRKSAPAAGEREMIRFYFEPVARTEAANIAAPKRNKPRRETLPQALRKDGVDGIKGVGGVIAFQANGTDMLTRVAAHAPKPYRAALRMAEQLPNNTPAEPEPWVPADLSGYTTCGVDLVNAYDSFDTLFERLADEPPGTFKQIMKSVRDDKDGPQVDIRKEIMQQLRPRVTLINDATMPAGPGSERYLVGVAANDAAAEIVLTQALRKCFAADRRFKARNFGGVWIWEYYARTKRKKGTNERPAETPGLCITVARGHLFISTHGALLEKVLTQQGPGLAQSADYQKLMGELTRLGMGPSSSRSFLRADAGVEATYELLRTGRLDQAKSLYGLLLGKWLTDEQGKMRAAPAKLPGYAAVAKYLGLAGAYTTTDDDGWTAVGAVLKK